MPLILHRAIHIYGRENFGMQSRYYSDSTYSDSTLGRGTIIRALHSSLVWNSIAKPNMNEQNLDRHHGRQQTRTYR